MGDDMEKEISPNTKINAEREYHISIKRWKRSVSGVKLDCAVNELNEQITKLESDFNNLVIAKTALETLINTEEELKGHSDCFKDFVIENNRAMKVLKDRIHDSDFEDPVSTTASRTNTCISNGSEKLQSLDSDPQHTVNNAIKDNDLVSTDNLITSINDNTNRSQRSLHSHKSKHSESGKTIKSMSSQRSILSSDAKAERAAKLARLKIELKFVDTETNLNSAMAKHHLTKEVAITEAEISALDEINNDKCTVLSLPQDKRSDMDDYLETQLRSVNDRNSMILCPAVESPVIVANNITQNGPGSIAGNVKNDFVHTFNPNADGFLPKNEDPITKLAMVLSDHHGREHLPKPEPEVFRGDSLQYPAWIKSFENFIEKRTSDSSELLFYLGRYTAGEAKESIKGLLFLETIDAYTRAKKLLQDRYGNQFIVANAFRKKLNDWFNIPPNDGPALRRFSDFLQNCKTAMQSIKYLNLLNDPEENLKILNKLPSNIAFRWSRIVDDCLNNSQANDYPDFAKFCTFLEKEARIQCNPITSQHILTHASTHNSSNDRKPRPTTSKPHDRKPASRSFATSSSKKESPCLLCKQNHNLDACKTFNDMSKEDKWKVVRDNSICRGCLSIGHMKYNCQERKICDKCKLFHPTSLHEDNFKPMYGYRRSTNEKKDGTTDRAQVHSTSVTQCVSHSLLVPIDIYHVDDPCNYESIYAIIDDQSDACFGDDLLLQKLNLKGTVTDLNLSTMSGTSTISCMKTSGLMVRGIGSQDSISLPETFIRDHIPMNRSQIPRKETARNWPHLNRIADEMYPYDKNMRIGLLIGINCIRAIKPLEVVPGGENDPYGIRTALGWGIVGMVADDDRNEMNDIVSSHLCTTTIDSKVCHFAFRTTTKEILSPKQVRNMFEQDFNENPNDKTISFEDSKFLRLIQNGIHQNKDGHFEMPLPFREEDVKLPNNRPVVMKRLKGLQVKFAKNERYKEDYQTFMKNIIDRGYAELVPQNEMNLNDGHVWYVPHHGVYHPKKPTKIRVVFDCSSTFQGEALNSHLLHGPDLTNSLVGVLCRFRRDKIAFICDIEAMFFQLKVNIEHRNYLRFFWWRDDDLHKEPAMYRMNVHLFGATSSPGCANYGLKATADKYEDEFGKDVAEFIRKDFYVDDGLKSVGTVKEAKDLIAKSQQMCSKGGFRLHKFLCNDKEVLVDIPITDRATGVKEFDTDKDHETIERALGVQWCVENDTFRFRIQLQDRPLTRRGILSTVSSVFDPLGLVSPVILTAKTILQDLCKESTNWDDPVPERISQQWIQWRTDLHQLAELHIPRSFKPTSFGKVKSAEMHHFSDASQSGYGQCSYLRLTDENDNIHVSLVLAKSRVAPTKPVTIPRLELTAAVVSSKVAVMLKNELQYNELQPMKEYFWTDSRVVLGYVSNDAKRFHTYVANRVQQIRNNSTPEQWNYVKSEDNPADDASRGIRANDLIINKRWWSGPEFLWDDDWTLQNTYDEQREIHSHDPEVRTITTFATTTTHNTEIVRKMSKFSDWHKLKMAISLCLRIQERYRKDSTATISNNGIFEPSTVDNLKSAEIEIIKAVQKVYYKDEIEILKQLKIPNNRHGIKERKMSLKTSSPIYKLDVFLDDKGLLRVGGRIQNADLPVDLTSPYILPKKSHITTLIVRYYHERTNHQGRSLTHNVIRSSGFWIIGGRSTISNIIAGCITCRKLTGKAQEQKMSSLPSDRLETLPPFTYSAVDYFGPWYVKEGRRQLKRYGVIFTCMSSRAVHLEVAHKMDTDSFLNAYRRFVCRRGPIRQLRSDQGSNFIGAQNELKAALNEMNDGQISMELLKDRCDWINFKMNVPESSHMGGSWERLIRSVRNVLVALLHDHSGILDDESLRTFMSEAESIVNSRPLTVNDINDPSHPDPITPNHLLTMKSQVVMPPPGIFLRHDLYVRKRWRRVQFLANEFWKRWRRDYVQTLQIRQKWIKPNTNLKVDDIVIVKDDNLPRNLWKLGIIVEVYPSNDMLVRKVKLRLGDPSLDKNGKRIFVTKYLERPIHKLILLSVDHPQGDTGIPVKEPL